MRLGVEASFVGGRLERGDVEVVDGLVTGIGLPGPGRGIAVPGFVDLQADVVDGGDAAGVELGEALERDLCHRGSERIGPVRSKSKTTMEQSGNWY